MDRGEWDLTSEQVHELAVALFEGEATMDEAVEWAAQMAQIKLIGWLERCNMACAATPSAPIGNLVYDGDLWVGRFGWAAVKEGVKNE